MSRFGVQLENTTIVERKKGQFSVGRSATFVGVLGKVGKKYGMK